MPSADFELHFVQHLYSQGAAWPGMQPVQDALSMECMLAGQPAHGITHCHKAMADGTVHLILQICGHALIEQQQESKLTLC